MTSPGRSTMCCVCLAVLLVSVASGAVVGDLLGMQVVVEPALANPARAICRVEWQQAAAESTIVVSGSHNAIVSGLSNGMSFVASDDGQRRLALRNPEPGMQFSFAIDLSALAIGEEMIVLSERISGPQRWQKVTVLRRTLDGFETDASSGFKITHVAGGRHQVVGSELSEFRAKEEASQTGDHGFFLVEALQPDSSDRPSKASFFEESFADISIPDGPTDCSLSSSAWTANGLFYIGSAPPGALSNGVTVHVTIVHPVMSDLQVAFFYDPNVPGGNGRYLYMQDPGVNLDQDFTRDVFNHRLPGYGESVNGYYNLGARDCLAGDTGYIDYWSLLVEYDSGATIDLVADEIIPDTFNVEPGDALAVNWSGSVSGSGTVGGSFNTGLFLSTDQTVDFGDVLLAQAQVSTANIPGDTFGESARTLTIPGGTADGTYYLIMRVDSGDVIDEVNETNNQLSALLEVATVPDEVDLVADSISATASTVVAGGNLTLSYAGHVEGTANVGGPFAIGVYLSADAVVTTSDIVLSRQNGSWANAPGETFGQSSVSLTVPGTTAPGEYTLGVIVDEGGAIVESNENNNTATTFPITVTQSGSPNLVAQDCQLDRTTVAPGETLVLSWHGLNSGDQASGPFTWSGDIGTGEDTHGTSVAQFDGGFVGSGWAAGWDPGSTLLSVTVPPSLSDGKYFVGVTLDIGNVVTESDESDNSCAKRLTVDSGGSATPKRWLIPAVVSAPGYGTSNWKSQVAVVNPTANTRIANLYYVAEGNPWPGTLLSGPVSIPANASSFLTDPLLPLNPTKGVLYVTLDDEGPVVTSRTYNLGADGSTYGQGIPALDFDQHAAPSELILPMVHSVPGRFHTNLGIVQTSAGSIIVTVSVYNANGALLATKNYSQSSSFRQIDDLFAKLNLDALSSEGAWIRVQLASGDPDFWTCYASVVDKETGDPTYIGPMRAE